MHGWLYSGESLYHTCFLYDKWYPAMLFLTLVVMAYWGHQADIRKKENIPSRLTSLCFRRFVSAFRKSLQTVIDLG